MAMRSSVQPVLGTILDHPDLTIALDDLGLHFTDFLVEELRPFLLHLR